MTEDSTFLFQSKSHPERIFAAKAMDIELAHFRAQAHFKVPGDVRYLGRTSTIEKQTELSGGKMELRYLDVKP